MKPVSLAPVFAALSLLLASGATRAAPATPSTDALPREARVVIALTTGDLATFEKRIVKGLPALAAAYREQGRELVPVVVIHGDAYKFFLRDLSSTRYASDGAVKARQPALRKVLEELSAKHGVRFEICRSGMRARDLDPKNVYAFVHVVPNAGIALIDWQQRGYAFLPVE